MRIDRQTLAWIHKDKEWMFRTRNENYHQILTPEELQWYYYRHIQPVTLIKLGNENIIFDGWGIYKWQHSQHLYPKFCECERCLGISEEWDIMKIKELVKKLNKQFFKGLSIGGKIKKQVKCNSKKCKIMHDDEVQEFSMVNKENE